MKHTHNIDDIFDTLHVAIAMSGGNKLLIKHAISVAKEEIDEIVKISSQLSKDCKERDIHSNSSIFSTD